MNTHKGFMTLGSLLASVFVGFGGLGSLVFMSQVKGYIPNNEWREFFADKEKMIASTVESMMIPPSAILQVHADSDDDQTPTPSPTPQDTVTTTPTPTPTPEGTVTPTLTPTPTLKPTDSDEDDDELENEQEDEAKDNDEQEQEDRHNDNTNQEKIRLSFKTMKDGWLKYKLMVFAKNN